MKTIKQMYSEAVKSMPVEQDGKPSPQETKRLRVETTFRFWITWLTILDPLDRRAEVHGGIKGIFETGRQSEAEILAGMEMLKQQLGVPRVTFSTSFKLGQILREACELAVTREDVDVALCAVLAFVQLELGGELDPEYGRYPKPERPPYEFDDSVLSDDPVETAILLEVQNDTSEDFGTSDYRDLRWFQRWEETLIDADKFELAFPGAGQHHPHLLQAVRPILEHLDPIHDGRVLERFLVWAKRLLQSPLEETLVPAEKASNKVA